MCVDVCVCVFVRETAVMFSTQVCLASGYKCCGSSPATAYMFEGASRRSANAAHPILIAKDKTNSFFPPCLETIDTMQRIEMGWVHKVQQMLLS